MSAGAAFLQGLGFGNSNVGVDAGRRTCWQEQHRHREACLLVGVDFGGSSIDDEEQPEELVAALHNDMLPHASADQGLTAPMGLVQ